MIEYIALSYLLIGVVIGIIGLNIWHSRYFTTGPHYHPLPLFLVFALVGPVVVAVEYLVVKPLHWLRRKTKQQPNK